jgi:hypothetical protein
LQTNYLKQKIYRATLLQQKNETAVHDAKAEDNYYKQEENNKVFSEQLEAQRHEIVETVEDINDIGASISSEMKEYLLHDIMEPNDNRDPILMEKLFGSPEAMFKANWF